MYIVYEYQPGTTE